MAHNASCIRQPRELNRQALSAGIQGENRGGPARPPELLERIRALLLVARGRMQSPPPPTRHQAGAPVVGAQGPAVPARWELELSPEVETLEQQLHTRDPSGGRSPV